MIVGGLLCGIELIPPALAARPSSRGSGFTEYWFEK